jgi:hypothetical protein
MASKSPQGGSNTSVNAPSSPPTAAPSSPPTAVGTSPASATAASESPTLVFWKGQLEVYKNEQTAAQNDLAARQTELQDPADPKKGYLVKLAADTKALGQLASDIAAMRAQLATTTIPADANTLVKEIADKIIEQRGLQGTVLDDQDAIDSAQAAIKAATATLTRATARVASVQATIAKVTTNDNLRQALKDAIAKPPLSTLKDDATKLKDGDTVKKATTRLGKNFPQELITIAGKRHDTRIKSLSRLETAINNAQDALGTGLAADAGKQGVVGQTRTAFQRAQSALSRYVNTALDRFNKAQTVMQMLAAIKDTDPDILTKAEKDQRDALASAGKAAEGKAEPIDTALNAVLTAQDDLDAQILTQINADVDTLSTDPTIVARRTAITTALKTYNDAITAFAAAPPPPPPPPPPNKKDLDQWEGVIPDDAWKVLLDFQEGMAALKELSDTDPTKLATDVDTAEDKYTKALADAEKAQRRADYYGDAIALRQGLRDSAQAAITKRLLSAIRGDTY